MGEIKYSKDKYDKLLFIYAMKNKMAKNDIEPMETNYNLVSESVTELFQIYDDIYQLINEYIDTFGDTLKSLQNAGDFIYLMDKKMSDKINNGSELLK